MAAAFGVGTVTLWPWRKELGASGVEELVPEERGPRGPSRVTNELVVDIRVRRRGGGVAGAIAALDTLHGRCAPSRIRDLCVRSRA